jgi:hypothetical protein
VDWEALIGTAESVLSAWRNSIFRDRVPQLDGIRKLGRLPKKRRKEVVL